MKDGISAITGVRGSLRDANTRIAEVKRKPTAWPRSNRGWPNILDSRRTAF
jgi:hypothetical protein